MEHYYFNRFSRQFGFHKDVLANPSINNLLDLEIILCCHHMLTHYGTGSQITLPWQCSLLKINITHAFHKC